MPSQASRKRKWTDSQKDQQSVDNPIGFLNSYQRTNMGEYFLKARGQGDNEEFQAFVTFRGKIHKSDNFHRNSKFAKKDAARVVIRENGGWKNLSSRSQPTVDPPSSDGNRKHVQYFVFISFILLAIF